MDFLPDSLLEEESAPEAIDAGIPRRLGAPVEARHAGYRIDRYLAEYFPFLARHGWQRRIRADRLFVNQRPTTCNYRLKEGDELTHLMPPGSEPEVSDDLQLIYQDEFLLAAAKPPNLPMHEGGYYHLNTFVRFVRQKFGDQWSPVHRLDLDTSGLVLCTGNSETREFMASQFRLRSMKKTYLFLSTHRPPAKEWMVDQALGLIEFRGYARHWLTSDGKPSQTHFEWIDQRGTLALVRARPVTGRTLQIRLHAMYSGVTILGDKLCSPDPEVYVGYKERGHAEDLNRVTGHRRACLHSESLVYTHPNGTEQQLNCPMADDMQQLWDAANSAAPSRGAESVQREAIVLSAPATALSPNA